MRYVHIDESGAATKINLRVHLRENYPNTSFPDVPSDEDLASYGVFPLREVKPTYDMATQVREHAGVRKSADGVWEDVWEVRDKTQAELDQERERERQDVKTQLEVGRVEKVILWAIFNQENRIRALEGRPEVTREQFINFLAARV